MKKLLFLLPVLISGFYACHREPVPLPVKRAPDYQQAESFLYRQNDSAFYYFNRVVTSSKDSLQTAMAYNYLGLIQSDAGDYFGSQESLLLSLRFLNDQKAGDRSCLSSDYNELGMASFNLKNYDAALAFYDRAIKFSDNSNLKAVILNNKANAYQQKKDYSKALHLYRVVIAQVKKNGTTYARILTNMATTKWLNQPGYQAAPELLKALRIRQKENDFWGENSSYAHLADYYTRSRPDSALLYAGEMYAVARRLNSPDDQLEALEKLIRAGSPRDAKRYFTRYRQLNDSVQTARNAAKNQFALIRYEAEKNKADNLKLQKDNTEKRYQIIHQQILLGSAFFVLVAGSIIMGVWYRKRKQRLALETQNTIRESALKTSKKVHDVVANGLYQLMSEIENREEVDKEQVLDKMDRLYERSRDISYEQPSVTGNFHGKIGALLTSFGNKSRKVAVAGNSEAIWQSLTNRVREELEQVLQELMVNMKKHSQASHVAVKFEKKANSLTIHYTDNGIGFPAGVQYKNGLTNTGNRINSVQGAITFDTSVKKGIKILITLPIA